MSGKIVLGGAGGFALQKQFEDAARFVLSLLTKITLENGKQIKLQLQKVIFVKMGTTCYMGINIDADGKVFFIVSAEYLVPFIDKSYNFAQYGFDMKLADMKIVKTDRLRSKTITLQMLLHSMMPTFLAGVASNMKNYFKYSNNLFMNVDLNLIREYCHNISQLVEADPIVVQFVQSIDAEAIINANHVVTQPVSAATTLADDTNICMKADDFRDIADEGGVVDTVGELHKDTQKYNLLGLWLNNGGAVSRIGYRHCNRLNQIQPNLVDCDVGLYNSMMLSDSNLLSMFPFRTAEEIEMLQKQHGEQTWKLLWTMSYDALWSMSLESRPSREEHRNRLQEFLRRHVTAAWLINAEYCLIHLHEHGEKNAFVRLSNSFLCLPVSLAPDVINEQYIAQLMTDENKNKYPWASGREAVTIIRKAFGTDATLSKDAVEMPPHVAIGEEIEPVGKLISTAPLQESTRSDVLIRVVEQHPRKKAKTCLSEDEDNIMSPLPTRERVVCSPLPTCDSEIVTTIDVPLQFSDAILNNDREKIKKLVKENPQFDIHKHEPLLELAEMASIDRKDNTLEFIQSFCSCEICTTVTKISMQENLSNFSGVAVTIIE